MINALGNKLCAISDKGPVRALSLILAFVLVGCIFWAPQHFAASTSPVAIWQGLLLIWAVCTALVHGFGFRPIRRYWRIFFAPLPALIVLIIGVVYFYQAVS